MVETGLDGDPNVATASGFAQLRGDRSAMMNARCERAHFFERRDYFDRRAIGIRGIDHLAFDFGRLLCADLLHPSGRSRETELRGIGVQLRRGYGFDGPRLRRLARRYIDFKRIYQALRK